MAERIANIILLVEDSCQDRLMRRYLQRLGQDHRNIRSRISPKGRGSAEQFVREQYALQVQAIRTRSTKACLIAMIDADTGSTDDRRQQLDGALQLSGQAARKPEEPILNLIPKRNVETWILCLNLTQVDEVADYRHDSRVDPQAIRRAAQTLFSWTRPNAQPPNTCVPSLRGCLPEFDRMG